MILLEYMGYTPTVGSMLYIEIYKIGSCSGVSGAVELQAAAAGYICHVCKNKDQRPS